MRDFNYSIQTHFQRNYASCDTVFFQIGHLFCYSVVRTRSYGLRDGRGVTAAMQTTDQPPFSYVAKRAGRNLFNLMFSHPIF